MPKRQNALAASTRWIALAGVAVSVLLGSGVALAQGASPRDQAAGSPEDIIVTARKREESILRTPVVLQAITAKQVQNLKITDMYQLSSVTPGLNIGVGFATVGAVANLRGLGNGLGATFVDQSVLLNIDGASLNQGQFYRTGLFDVGQIEVLKGPQALFYGKSSPAGIVAIHSADPTPQWEAKASIGYEFVAHEMPVDAYISGPLTESLGIRVAGFYSRTTRGYLTNRNPDSPNRHFPSGRDYGGRLTLKFDNNSGFRAKLKLSASRNRDTAFDGDLGQRHCSGPTPQVAAAIYDDCRINTIGGGNPGSLPYRPDLNFAFGDPAPFYIGAPHPLFGNGKPYQETNTRLAILNVDYDFTPELTLNSVSAYSQVKAKEAGRSFLSPGDFLVIAGDNNNRDYSQELRLTSDFDDSWINFVFGGVYDKARIASELVIDIPGFTFLTDDSVKLTTKTASAFGQVLLTPIERWELSVGARYTHVHKYFTSLFARSNVAPSGEQVGNVPYSVRSISQDQVTPEVTLTYRPTDELTIFASYKRGYKGPGFNANVSSPFFDASVVNGFGGEKAEGGEGGIKASLLDRHLTLTASVYNYKYDGLQVAFVDNTTHSVRISPSADARVRGIEAGVDFRVPGIEGLTLNAFVNLNDAKYTSFANAPCYGGQTAAMGCTTSASGDRFQNLRGRRLNNAPKWIGRIGAEYRTELSAGYMAGISVNSNFSSSYNYVPEQSPVGVQGSYFTLDTAVRFGPSDGLWEIALIGRNLTNKAIVLVGQDEGAVTQPGGISDALGIIARARQLLMQLTVRPKLF